MRSSSVNKTFIFISLNKFIIISLNELNKINYKNLKKSTMNKYFLIYSEKLLKRLNHKANIRLIEKLK